MVQIGEKKEKQKQNKSLYPFQTNSEVKDDYYLFDLGLSLSDRQEFFWPRPCN